jgi:hypothetical protein
MIDLKQFEGHTEGPWVIVPCDISKSELKKLSVGVHAIFPKTNLEDGETKALCILSAFTQFSEEDQATWKLMQKAPELLKEVSKLRSVIDLILFNSEEETTVLQTVIEENRILKKQIEKIKESLRCCQSVANSFVENLPSINEAIAFVKDSKLAEPWISDK